MRRLLALFTLLVAVTVGGQTDTFRLFRGPGAYLPACDSSRYGEPAYETDAHIYVICSYSNTWDQFWPQSSLDTFRLFRGPAVDLPACDPTRYGQPAYETDTHAYVICSTANSWDVFMPADPAMMRYLGAWSSGTSYKISDVVTDSGSMYVCIAVNSATEPPNVSYWTLVGGGGTGSTVASGITYNASPTPWAFTTPTPDSVQQALDKIAVQVSSTTAPTPQPTPTPRATDTPIPPVSTATPRATDTPIPPVATDTPIPPVATDTPIPPVATDTPIPAPTVPPASAIGYLATPTPWAFTTPTPGTVQSALDKIASWIGLYQVPTPAPTATPIPAVPTPTPRATDTPIPAPTVPSANDIGYLATPTPWAFTTPTPGTVQRALDLVASWIGAYQTPTPIPAPTLVPTASPIPAVATATPRATDTPIPAPTVAPASAISYLATPTPWAFTTPTPSTVQGAVDQVASWISAYQTPSPRPTDTPIPAPTVPPSSAVSYLATPTPWAFTTPTPSTVQGAVDKIAQWISGYQTPTPQPTPTAGGAGANTALSNLSAVAVNLALAPGTDNSIALDSSAKRFTSGYFSTGVGVYNAASDANPTAILGNGVVNLGAGGGTAVDVGLSRYAPGVFQITDGSTGTGSIRGTGLRFYDNGTHYSAFGAQTQTADLNYILPAAHAVGWLKNDGAGNLAWTVPITTISSWSTIPYNNASSTQAYSSLTTREVQLFSLPFTITVNQISQWISTDTTAGTTKLCVYSADGATKYIDVTESPSGTGIQNTTVASVTLSPGQYYFVVGCATTCSHTSVSGVVESTATMFGSTTPSGKLPWHGQVTHTSGTCNSTLGTVTGGTDKPILFRLDN
jgi:hypothetical protein